MVQAKFYCSNKSLNGSEGAQTQAVVTLLPVSGSGYNKDWSKYTPAGKIEYSRRVGRKFFHSLAPGQCFFIYKLSCNYAEHSLEADYAERREVVFFILLFFGMRRVVGTNTVYRAVRKAGFNGCHVILGAKRRIHF